MKPGIFKCAFVNFQQILKRLGCQYTIPVSQTLKNNRACTSNSSKSYEKLMVSKTIKTYKIKLIKN